jgi:hypothetical protein
VDTSTVGGVHEEGDSFLCFGVVCADTDGVDEVHPVTNGACPVVV